MFHSPCTFENIGEDVFAAISNAHVNEYVAPAAVLAHLAAAHCCELRPNPARHAERSVRGIVISDAAGAKGSGHHMSP